MTQRDQDRLVVLKKAQKKLITQRQAAVELDSARAFHPKKHDFVSTRGPSKWAVTATTTGPGGTGTTTS